MNLCSSVTGAALRKYVYTCFPGLVYNECQVTLLFLQIYFSMSVPNNSYCKRLLLSRLWNVWNTIRFGTKTCHDKTFFLLKKTINCYTLHCTFWNNYAISARTHKTVIFSLEFSFFQISSLYGTDAYIIDITANQMICSG